MRPCPYPKLHEADDYVLLECFQLSSNEQLKRCFSPNGHCIRFGVLAVSMALGFERSVQAAHPQIAIIKPSGLQRGTEIEVEVTGARLNDVKQVLFYDPGLKQRISRWWMTTESSSL